MIATMLVAAVCCELVDASMAGGAFLLWVAKDFALYPLLKRAYETRAGGYPLRLVGRSGKAREDLAPRGYVLVAGELWRAQVTAEDLPIHSGEVVVVVGVAGSRLLVRRAQGAETDRST